MTGRKCPPHAWNRENVCARCGVSFREWCRGFGSNVQPRKKQRRA